MKKQYHNHLVRGIPNTPENREFWENLRQLTKESDSMWTLRIRGRRPSADRIQILEGCDAEEAHQSALMQNRSGFVPLDIAEIFSVYAEMRDTARETQSKVRHEFYRNQYQRGIEEGRRIERIEDGQHGCTSRAELLEQIEGATIQGTEDGYARGCEDAKIQEDKLHAEIDRLKQQVQTQDEILEQRDVLVNEMLTENYELKRQRSIKQNRTVEAPQGSTITITIKA